jgi:glycosyltransferase involved in cell wall biosynthesis
MTRELTCMVVSHSYLEPEVAKNLDALADHLRVVLVTPRVSPVLVFADRDSRAVSGGAFEVLGFRRVPRRGGSFLLGSLRLGFQRAPDFVLIEYDPWLPLFWQILAARRLFAPRARVFIAVKKNTFRPGPRPVAYLKRRLARAGLRRVSGVFTASAKAAELYRREFSCPPAILRVLTMHPVDTATFAPAAAGPPGDGVAVIGFVGHVSRRKGADVLIRAVESLHSAGERVTLRMLGPVGDVADEVRRATERGFLSVLPPVDNGGVADALRGLDVFVMPSARLPDHEEHDGRALLEAMACGLACVGSDSGVIPELLADGRGRIFPAGDAQALADELRELLHSPEERGRMAGPAREYVRQEASTTAVALARFSTFVDSLENEEILR